MSKAEELRKLSVIIEELLNDLRGNNIPELEDEILLQKFNGDIVIVYGHIKSFRGLKDGDRRFEGTRAQRYWIKIEGLWNVIKLKLEGIQRKQEKESNSLNKKHNKDILRVAEEANDVAMDANGTAKVANKIANIAIANANDANDISEKANDIAKDAKLWAIVAIGASLLTAFISYFNNN